MRQIQLQDHHPVGDPEATVHQSRRIPLERKVVLKFHHFGGFFIEYSANVSLTGMFIKTDSPKPPGSIFIFEVWLGDEYKLVHGVGEVVWVRNEDEGSDRPAGMGIRYLKIAKESTAVVERVIAEHVLKGGKVFDLAAAGTGAGIDNERRSDLELMESASRTISRDDLLILDEDLLGFDRPAEEPTKPVELRTDETESSGRGLWISLLLVGLAAVMGGAAYLFSADLLPF